MFILILSLFPWRWLGAQPVRGISIPEWARDASIYEVNVRQYTAEGTFNAFAEHLPRLKDMGVKILWIMPIHPIGEINRKGNLGSYYSVKDYLAVNPELGTLEDFKALVNKAHELGMYVIIDWVANHSAWDNPLASQYPDWYKHGKDGSFVSPFDWTDVIAFDYSNPDMRQYMTEAMLWWVKNTDIDGFRCDVAGMVPVDFWDHTRKVLDAVKPVFMLAEADDIPLMYNAFDMAYNWKLMNLMHKVAQGKAGARQIDSLITRYLKNYPEGSLMMNFTSNHDENSWAGTEYERYGQGALALAVLTATIPGMPLIYTGQEEPLMRRLNFFDRDPVDFHEYKLAGFYKALLDLKKSNPALWNGTWGGSYRLLKTSGGNQVMAFIRQKGENNVLVILNLSEKPVDFTVEDKAAIGNWLNVFSGDSIDWATSQALHLEPWQYLVLTRN
ncbi:MAG: alpha-amylase family glycosyl hydrolase [Bacteroidales bacterium]